MAVSTYLLTVNFDENVEAVNVRSGEESYRVEKSGESLSLMAEDIHLSVDYKPGFGLFSLIASGAWGNAFSEIRDGEIIMKPLGDFGGAITVKSKKAEVLAWQKSAV